MTFRIKAKDVVLLVAAGAFVFVAVALISRLAGDYGMAAGFGIVAMIALFGSFEIYRRLQASIEHNILRTMRNDYRQLEALLSLIHTVKPTAPLPAMRDWAASPDFLKTVSEVIFKEKPRLVVEASSGVSTLISAYSLRQIGGGKVISLEHDADYAQATRDRIALHGLEDIATVVHAPLVEVTVEGRPYLWYDWERAGIDRGVDLLVVDGPPADDQDMARYPAVPLLFDHLNDGAVIVLDDGDRGDETKTAKRWSTQFDGVSCEHLPLEKGAWLLRKKG